MSVTSERCVGIDPDYLEMRPLNDARFLRDLPGADKHPCATWTTAAASASSVRKIR